MPVVFILTYIQTCKAKWQWNGAQTIKCLEEYAKHSCLWDSSNSNYKNKHERNLALQIIVQKLNIDNFDIHALKLKIHSIRNTYVNEITKILKSTRSGAATVEVYKPKLSWFKLADSFLRNIVKKRVHYSNVHVVNIVHTYPSIHIPVYLGRWKWIK